MQETIFSYMDPAPPCAPENSILKGLTVAIQPNLSVRGWPTQAGSRALEGFIAIEDATVVERLRQAGATIKGATYMSELGLGLTGDTGADALKNNEADIVIITDNMGESRVSACAAGVFGFKPSYGIVSRFGLIGLIPSMECFGILAKKLADVSMVIGVIAGNDSRDLSMPDFGPESGPELKLPDFSRVFEAKKPARSCGVIRECLEIMEKEELSAFEATISKLAKRGIQTIEIGLEDFNMVRTVHNIIGAVEASSSAGKYDSVRYGHRAAGGKNWNEMYINSRAESFGVSIKSYLFQGSYFQNENYNAFVDAARIRGRLSAGLDQALENADFLMLPTIRKAIDPFTADTVNEIYDSFPWTLIANITGHPAITLPKMVVCKDMDIGMQIIGPRFKDANMLSIAAQLSIG
ncbi:MAG: amidase family protein [Desulfobacterales bacterium]|nr:amidase family protein [Desulfobacterales bacterium]